MTSPTQTGKQDGQPAAAAAADGKQPPAKTEDARLDALEREQQRQGGLLEQISAAVLGKTAGAAPDAPPAAQHVTETRLERSSNVIDQMRQAVRDVNAEAAQQQADAQHQAEHERMRQQSGQHGDPPRQAENQPAEQGGALAAFRRRMYGPPDGQKAGK